jgi:DNA-binding response OmpR family regulator
MTELADGVAQTCGPVALERTAGAPSRPRGVLVIDDDAGIRAFLRDGLRAAGFAVWPAADGREGVAVYRNHSSAIDLVLLDVRMPGWDGPETLTEIRALAPDLPCCFMSGDIGKYTEEELLGRGAVALFRKPFHYRELVVQLRQLTAAGARHEAS